MIDRWRDPDVEVSIGSERRVLPARSVAKIDRMPVLAAAPAVPAPVLGIAIIGGQVMPVVDLGALLGLAPCVPAHTCQIVVVRQEKNSLALLVDRVVRVSADRQGGNERLIDVADLFARLVRLRPSLAHASRVPATAAFPKTILSSSSIAARPGDMSALAVATSSEVHYLSLQGIAAVFDELPIIAVPDPRPALIGVAIHTGNVIPVLRLDHLLGKPQGPTTAQGARVVLTSSDGTCAVAVRQVIGFTSGIKQERRLDLIPLVRPFLDRSTRMLQIPHARSQTHQDLRYLLVEIAGQFCAFRLNEVARVQSRCAMVPVPRGWANNALGLTNIEGSVLPLLDAGAMLGLRSSERPSGYVVLTDQNAGSFVVSVHRLLRIVAFADATLRVVGGDTLLAGIGTYDERTVWVFSTVLLAERAGWRRHAA